MPRFVHITDFVLFAFLTNASIVVCGPLQVASSAALTPWVMLGPKQLVYADNKSETVGTTKTQTKNVFCLNALLQTRYTSN